MTAVDRNWWSPAEAIERLDSFQDQLNACTLIERRPPPGGDGPLSGLPIVVKDLIDQVGLPNTCGSGFYRPEPPADAEVVRRLRTAGAAIVGRSGLHEWAYGFSSENPWFGPIRNPWDLSTSPGGSSGGSAVAVAAGLVPAAIGTDTGGSVRVPAALTGIYGLKVTWGRIPTSGVFPLAPSLDSIGPLARDVETLTQCYRAMAGAAPTGIPLVKRIGIPSGWVSAAPGESSLGYWFGRLRDELVGLGFEIVEINNELLVPWGRIQELAGYEAARVHQQFREQGKPYGPEVGTRLDAAERVTGEEYAQAHRWRAQLVEAFASAFEQVDLLMTPAVAARRKVIGQDLIGGEAYRPVLSWFSALVNHAANPAIAIPLTIDSEPGLPPPSLQLIAPWWQEETLLGIAGRLEQEGLAGFRPPPVGVI